MQKELQTAYQRWELASFGDERPAAVARRAAEQEAVVAAPKLPTEAEIAAILENARAEGLALGRAAGHAEGLAQGRAEATAELQRLRTIADTFGQAVARADETIASDVLDLALHLARGMVKTAFEVRPDLIIPVVREAIEYLPVLQQPALLMLNPLDAPVVRAGIGEELEKGGWRVVEDAQVGRGGCKIDTASNQIDAQAATRWQRLSHALGKNVDWLEP
ncbi:flagellar assembly protein FliH [Massilia agilis]|uniref:Flagellar assembly protein FliH n=1 Tax=Massilia agilis TaxID=1811226 RepID=A0ABT2D7V0_9BURK|nr:flagellar assembly protein FliH [Massilia agilis]MCS0807387.1 flagellar assembly protein FliH [Massilia agilis]